MIFKRFSRLSFRLILCSLVFGLLCAGLSRASAQTQSIYDDKLVNSWQSWSWATVNLANTSPVHAGTDSIAVTDPSGYEAIWLHPGANMSTSGFVSITFWLYTSNPSGLQVGLSGISATNTVNGTVSLPVTPVANTWTKETITLSSIGCSNITNFAGFWIQNKTSTPESAYYMDDVTLDAPQVSGPAPASITVDPTTQLGVIPPTQEGVNTATWDGYLTDSNTAPLLSAAGVKMLRYPGGSWADAYHWQTNSGTTGSGVSPNQNDGFDSFMNAVAIPLGAMPIITCNYGSNLAGTAGGDPNEAAAWVQYSNVTKGYGVKYWEIGNEVYGSWEEDLWPSANDAVSNPTFYGQEVVQYVNAMKAVDPTIKVGVVLQLPGQTDYSDGNISTDVWNQAVMAQCGTKVDFVIVHWYPEYVNDNDSILLADPSQIPGFVTGLKSLISTYSGSNASNVKIMVTETNSDASNPGKQMLSTVNALFMSDNIQTWLEKGAANVDYWDLRNGAGNGDSSSSLFGTLQYGDEGILSTASSTVVNGVTYTEPPVDTPFPAYYALQMNSILGKPGDKMITSSSNQALVATHAVQHADGSIGVLMINKDSLNTYNTTVSLPSFAAGTNGTYYVYGPTTTTIGTGTFAASSSVNFSLPPYTMETLTIPPASQAVPTPVITPASGTYQAPLSVHIKESQSGSTLKYTTDGSDPLTSATATSVVVTNQNSAGGISVSLLSSVKLTVVAVETGYSNSSEVSATYNLAAPLPPVTTAILAGTHGTTPWYISPVTVTLATVDNSLTGIKSTFYTIDGGTQQTYSAPFVVSGDLVHKIQFWSVDNFGDTEATNSQSVNIDSTLPVTTESLTGTQGSNGWYTSNVTVNLVASDNLSGIYRTYYTLDGGTAQSYLPPLTVSGDKAHTVTYWAVDVAGNTETTHTQTVNIDTTLPVTTAVVSGTQGSGGWYTSTVNVALNASDATSGIANTYYTVDGGAAQTYSAAFPVSGNSNHSITYWSVDKAGNTESTHSQNVNIDTTTPVTTASLAGTLGNSGWYISPVTVTLTGTDTVSGIVNSYYTVDGSAQSTYSAPFVVSGDAVHKITFWSVSKSSSVESAHTQTINIDAVAPVTLSTVAGTLESAGYYASSVTVTLSATDDLSGVNTTYYAIDGGTQQTYTAPLAISSQGVHTVTYYSTDIAGNSETAHSQALTIDTGGPITTASLTGTPGSNGWYTSAVTVTLSAIDAASTVASTYYTIDGGSQQTYSAPFVVSGDLVHTITFWSVDTAGATETPNKQTINIDATSPVTTSTLSGTKGSGVWYTSNVSITINATDNLSGIASAFYSVDNGSSQPYTSSITVSGDGPHTVQYWSIDNAGNTESVHSQALSIDSTSPVTTANLAGTLGTGGYYLGSVTVTLSATDTASGIHSTFCTVDGGSQQTYSSPLVIAGNGSHSITFWSVDNAGNVETTHSLGINIDSASPVTSASLSGSQGLANWYTSSVTVTLSATDSGSGVAGTYFTVDGGAQQTYSAPFTVSGDAVHTLTYWSVSNSGVVEGANSQGISIDSTTSVTLGNLSGTQEVNGTYVGSVTLTLSATDNLSGIASTYYTIDGGASATYITPVNVTAAASHTVTYWSTDVAGNVEPTHTTTFSNVSTLSLSLSPTIVNGGAVNSGTSLATITTPIPAPAGGWTFNIVSSTPSATVPAQVNMAAGTTFVTFTVNTTAVASATTAMISASLNGSTASASLQILTPAPTTTASVSGTKTSGGWYSGPVTVTLAAADHSGTGIKATYYTINGGSQTTYTGPISLSAWGNNTLTYWSVDNSGGTEAPNTLTLTLSPILSLVVSPTSVPGGTSATGTITVSTAAPAAGFTCTASSSSANINVPANVVIAAGAKTGTFTIATTNPASPVSGVITIGLDGESVTANLAVTVADTTPPVTTVSLSGTQISSGIYTGTVTVTLTATDNLSGVATTNYTLNGGTKTKYSAPFTDSKTGLQTLTYWSVDKANNTETAHTLTFTIVPTVSVKVSPTSVSAGASSTGTVSISTSAPSSGWTILLSSSSQYVPLAGSSVTIASGKSSATFPITTLPVPATQTATIGANLDGVTASANLTVTVVLPSTTAVVSGTLSAAGSWYVTPVTLTLTSADHSGTGIKATYYTVNGGTQTLYSGPVTFTAWQSYTITYWSVDNAGNTEAAHTLKFVMSPLVKVTLNPATLKGGTSATGTITVGTGAPSSGFVCSMSSSSSLIIVPRTVTMTAGSTSVNVTITTRPTSANISGVVTVTLDGESIKTTLSVTP